MKPAEFSIPSGAVSCAGDPFAALTQEDKTPLTAAVRYGYMKLLGQFIYKHGLNLVCGSRVIVETDRGVEIGRTRGTHLQRLFALHPRLTKCSNTRRKAAKGTST